MHLTNAIRINFIAFFNTEDFDDMPGKLQILIHVPWDQGNFAASIISRLAKLLDKLPFLHCRDQIIPLSLSSRSAHSFLQPGESDSSTWGGASKHQTVTEQDPLGLPETGLPQSPAPVPLCSAWRTVWGTLLSYLYRYASVKVAQLCPTLCDPVDYSLWNSPARILEWVDSPFSRGLSQRGNWTWVSHTVGRFFTSWASREALGCENRYDTKHMKTDMIGKQIRTPLTGWKTFTACWPGASSTRPPGAEGLIRLFPVTPPVSSASANQGVVPERPHALWPASLTWLLKRLCWNALGGWAFRAWAPISSQGPAVSLSLLQTWTVQCVCTPWSRDKELGPSKTALSILK